jgi:hypothetical protein
MKPGRTLFVVIIVIIILLAASLPVRAAGDIVHLVQIYNQIDHELLPSTTVGQYYRSLVYGNMHEINDIYNTNLEHALTITYPRLELFVPGLEALVNGRGSTVTITSEEVDALQQELDWLLTQCSPEFCEDITHEEERFPLTLFIGMSFQEAWDYLNANWQPDR